MFTTGHLLFIALSAVIIGVGVLYCVKKKPPIRRVLIFCLMVGVISEMIKILGNMKIVPIVEPMVQNGNLIYQPTGQYTPYIEAEHYPFELCTYQIFFMIVALMMRDGIWKKRLYALMYTTCIVGAGMAIVFNSSAPELTKVSEFVGNIHIWRSFLYHSMLIILGTYIGISKECNIHFKDLKGTIFVILFLDLLTMYINSMMSKAYYVGDQLMGVSKAINYFSSYANPLGIAMENKTAWYIYLLIRLVLAILLMTLVNLPLYFKNNKKNG